jgi:hypothetical protein
MTATAIKTNAAQGLAPFSLKDAPSFIEAQFPVGRLSAEAYKERKAIIGQTLTALGSYWKGRKPLILARTGTRDGAMRPINLRAVCAPLLAPVSPYSVRASKIKQLMYSFGKPGA